MNTKLIGTAFAAVLGAAALTGCQPDATNTNANVNRNANMNANTAVVVNTTPSPANMNANANRWGNANISREEYDRRRAEYERDRGTSAIGQGVNDSWLWFKTRAALLATDDLRESTINVDVENDVITLRGTVANPAQKTRAEQVAKGIEGQKGVRNELKVAPADSITNMNTNANRANANR